MKNILIIENGIATLLANADDGTNTIFINDEDIPASDWVGTGTYEYIESGVTFTIQKIEADTGNIMLQLIEGTSYRLVKQLKGQPYESGDPLSADLDNADYVPFYDVSANTRKNSLFSNIIAKIEAAIQISDLTNQVKDMNNVLGAKNLLPYPYSQTTKTSDGVTFTDNGDGSITLNGTNTGANTTFMFRYRPEDKTIRLFTELKKMNTSFKLLGGNDIPRVVYNIDFYDSSSTFISSVMNRNDTPTVFTIPSNAESANIFIRCVKDAVYSNLTIYPMLYLASIEDNTYVPYAKTNKQLTEDTLVAYKTADSASTTINDTDYVPISESNGTTRKKALWTTIIAKIKSSLATVATSGSYNDLSDKPTIPSVVNNLTSDSTTNALSAAQGKALANGSARDSTKLPLAGGTMTGRILRNITTGSNYISGVKGTASALHLDKAEGNKFYAALSTRTAGGGGWAIGNYDNEDLEFIYGTKANIESDTNTTIQATLRNKGGVIALTSDFKAGRGIFIGGDGGTQIFIKPWESSPCTAVNANAATYFRYIAGFCIAYQTVFYVDRTSVVTPINITVDGTLYRYAPLFSLTAEQASSLLYSASDLPASGAEVSLTRIVNALNGTSTSRLRLAKSGSTYYLIDDALRSTTTNSNTGINNVLSQGKRNYNMPGVLYFLYNIT